MVKDDDVTKKKKMDWMRALSWKKRRKRTTKTTKPQVPVVDWRGLP